MVNEDLSTSERTFCDLHSIGDVEAWLNDPQNQIRSSLYIIMWDGAAPAVATSPFNRLEEGGRGLLEVVLLEHRRRRSRPDPESKSSETEVPDGTMR